MLANALEDEREKKKNNSKINNFYVSVFITKAEIKVFLLNVLTFFNTT